MILPLHPFLPAVLTAGELALFFLAGYSTCRRWGHTVPEAVAAGLVLALMTVSLIVQTAFLIGLPPAVLVLELAALLLAGFLIRSNRNRVVQLPGHIRLLLSEHPICGTALCLATAGLLAQSLAWPQTPAQWDHLAAVRLFHQQGGFYAALNGGSAEWGMRPAAPVNALVLPHLLLRFGSDIGSGLFGFAAWLSIGFSTYALARRYAWPPTAFTVAVVVICFPRLVLHATTPGIELVPAAAALFAILEVYRLGENPDHPDLLLLLVTTAFAVSALPLGAAFPVILLVLTAVLLFRRHGVRVWGAILWERPSATLAVLWPAAIFSQLWVWIGNAVVPETWTGLPVYPPMAPNPSALQGAFANLIRYGLEAMDLTIPVDAGFRWLFGLSPVGVLEGAHAALVEPIFGNSGAAAPFRIIWAPDATFSWFGPLGFLLTLPAMIYALIRGPRRLKALALALTVYIYILCLVPAWIPGNARYFTTFFVCSGFCIAFSMPPWRLSNAAKHALHVMSVLLLLYAAVGAMVEPVVRPGGRLPNTAATAGSRWIAALGNRFGNPESLQDDAQRVLGDRRLETMAQLAADGERIGVATGLPGALYPLLAERPDVRFFYLQPDMDRIRSLIADGAADAFFFLDRPPPPDIGGICSWQALSDAALPGAVIRLVR